MILTDMTFIERFKNMARAKRFANKVRKALDLPKIKVLFIEQLPPGFNALFVTHCLLVDGHYLLNDVKGEPTVFLDMHYALPQYQEQMMDRLAHELRHFYQFLFLNQDFMSLDYQEVLSEGILQNEVPEFYSWREVDARNWAEWFCAGSKDVYVTPRTDSEIRDVMTVGNDAGFLGSILARFDASAKFVFDTFE